MLVVARYDVRGVDPTQLADELVRNGARDAHETAAGTVAITVAAESEAEAATRARALLRKAGVTDARLEQPTALPQPRSL